MRARLLVSYDGPEGGGAVGVSVANIAGARVAALRVDPAATTLGDLREAVRMQAGLEGSPQLVLDVAASAERGVGLGGLVEMPVLEGADGALLASLVSPRLLGAA